MKRFKLPSPAMMVACIALAVAMSGASYAAVVLPKNSVRAKQIAPNAVGASEIKRGAVRSGEVLDGSLSATDFAPGQLGSPNADTLDGVDSTGFYRAGSKVADSETLDGVDSTGFYGAGSKVADADKLDGNDSTAFLQNGSAAGGRLSGTYPNPTIPVGSIDGTDVNEGTLAQVPSAVIADDATPYAYAQVNANGTLNTTSGSSQNIASVSKYNLSGTARTGVYCISIQPGITVRSAVASAQFSNIASDADAIVNVFVNIFAGGCPSGTDAIVTIWDASANAFDDEDFYIWLLR